MDREAMGKEFLDNLERILVGEEVEFSPAMTEDCRSALGFARQMIRLRVAPAPLFQSRLREKLLRKLDETHQATPAEEGGSFWERLAETWRRPVWRTVTVTLLVALITVGVMGRMGAFSRFAPPEEAPAPLIEIPPPQAPEPTPSPEPAPAPAPIPAPTPLPIKPPPLEITATAEKEAYLPGEAVTIEFTFENTTDEPYEIAPYPPGIEVLDTGPQEEAVRSFPAGNLLERLEAGETVSYELTWDQLDNRGEQVDYGYYQLLLPEFPPRLNGFYILPAEGVFDERIKVGESQTVNGVTCTWEQVWLRPGQLSFFAVIVPPDYDYAALTQYDPAGPPPPPPPLPVAEYQVDDAPPVEIPSPSIIDPFEEGIRYVWQTPVPIPRSRRQLSFTITRWGDIEGPWQFQLPLE